MNFQTCMPSVSVYTVAFVHRSEPDGVANESCMLPTPIVSCKQCGILISIGGKSVKVV